MEESSESESDLPFWDQKVKYCYTLTVFFFILAMSLCLKDLLTLLKNKNFEVKKSFNLKSELQLSIFNL